MAGRFCDGRPSAGLHTPILWSSDATRLCPLCGGLGDEVEMTRAQAVALGEVDLVGIEDDMGGDDWAAT